MKFPRWLPYMGIIAFYITLIVVLRIWLSPVYFERRESERAPAMRRWAAQMERVVQENEKLRAIVVRDSLMHLVPDTPGLHIISLGDSVNVVERRPRAEPAEQRASIQAIAVREAGQDPKASITLIGFPVGYGGHPEVREGVWRRLYFSGNVNGRPYCVVAIPTFGKGLKAHEAGMLTRSGILGQCAFWSRYGPPGNEIQRWLELGGAHFAGSDYVSGVWEYADRHSEQGPSSPRDSRFLLPLAGQACLGGREEVCARAVTNPRTIYGIPDSALHVTEWDTRLAPGERTLLIKLERDFGPERFQRFWTSNQPFEEAFQEAFGVELGAWVRHSLQSFGQISRGARVGGTSVVLTVLFLGACLGAALATAHRRRV
jgi:hypothetical protein